MEHIIYDDLQFMEKYVGWDWYNIASMDFFSSQFGAQIFGKWNVFSYTFRPIEYISDMGWLCGEMLSVALAMLMVALVPVIIKKRG